MFKSLPPLPLPVPFMCSDEGSFAETTLLVRLPEIARRVILENKLPAAANQAVEALITDMPDGRMRPLQDPLAPDLHLWQAYLQPHLGKSWRQLSFLECENVFYRRVLEATGYFGDGPSKGLDPYGYQKQLGLTTSRHGFHSLAARLDTWRAAGFDPAEALSEAIQTNLWGNRADLSLWPADAESTLPNTHLHQPAEFMLTNQIPEVVDTLLNISSRPRRVDFLVDNAGYEVVCDLALADLLLSRGLVDAVHFHLKAHPTFVSDALAADVQQSADFLANEADPATSAFGKRLQHSLQTGQMVLQEEFFWNSPLPTWEMPLAIFNDLAQAALVFSKGDANYRRLIGDLRWVETTPFSSITAYFPTRLAALRTAKSQVISGLVEGQLERLAQADPGWRTNGKWGLVQVNAAR